MNILPLVILASALIGCLSAVGLIVTGLTALLLRCEATEAAKFLSFSFVAAMLGFAVVFIPMLIEIAANPNERAAYFSGWQGWLLFAGLPAPHLLWFRQARRPIPAAVIASTSILAITPEFLFAIAGA